MGLVKKIAIRACCAVLLLPLAVVTAHADQVTYNLNGSNLGSGFNGPFATVTVDRTSSTTAALTFDSLSDGSYIYLLGDGGTAGVNVNAASWTLGAITGANSISGFTPGPYSNGGSGNEDGFGSFSQKINTFDGFTHSSTEVTFTLTDTSGTWLSAANVLTPNGNGQIAAVHIFACAEKPSGCLVSNGAVATGFASDAHASPVPEPSSLALFGTMLLVAGFVVRRHLGITG